MIVWKIKAWRFFYPDLVRENWLKNSSIIEVVHWYNWQPYKNTIEEVKRFWCCDWYYPKQKKSEESDNMFWNNRFDTYVIETDAFISIYEKDG